MKQPQVPKSPVRPAEQQWDDTPDPNYYESGTTAMLRSLVKDEEIRKDQAWAWARWRSGKPDVTKD
jgi:hypothetical protein